MSKCCHAEKTVCSVLKKMFRFDGGLQAHRGLESERSLRMHTASESERSLRMQRAPFSTQDNDTGTSVNIAELELSALDGQHMEKDDDTKVLLEKADRAA